MSTVTAAQRQVLKGVKEAPALVIFLIFVSEIGLNWLYVNFLYEPFSVPASLTDGLVQPIFVLSFLKAAFIILGVVFWIGKFNNHDLGATFVKFRTGIITAFFLWALLQLVMIGVGALSSTSGALFTGLTEKNPLYYLGTFILFAFSKALYDEVIYRGLVLPQFHLKARRFINLPSHYTLTIAIVLSQIIYLIIQMPLISTAHDGESSLGLTFLSLFLLSLLNAVIYIRTHNIFVSVGIHALWFYPLFIVNSSIQQEYLIAAAGLGLLALWPMLPKQDKHRRAWPRQEQRIR